MINTTKRIIIHTGPGKTGSSAIQAWLTQHVRFLNENGVNYPHHGLSKDKISSGNLRKILTQKENGSWVADEKKITQLIADFEVSEFKFLLLSSEFFFHNIIDIQKCIPQAEFVAYIRNPLELLESNYNQGIKRHSQINKFVAPKSLENYFWPYLSKVFDHVDAQKIHLRPYDASLMSGGNIISDLLSVLGLETEVEDRNINPSFTFPALEFKRLMNHLELEDLDPALDQALQACKIGTLSYSLMEKDVFTELNEISCRQMQQFIKKYQQDDLLPLLDCFKSAKQRQFQPQVADANDLNSIAAYLKEQENLLYLQLQALVKLHDNLWIDNPNIYDVFAVDNSLVNRDILPDEALLKHINQFTVHPSKRGKICYELACYFDALNDTGNALKFATGSHFFNPGNLIFKQKLNQVQIKLNKYQPPLAITVSSEPSKTQVKDSMMRRFFRSAKISRCNIQNRR